MQPCSWPRSQTPPRAPSPPGRSSVGWAGGEREAVAPRSLRLGWIRPPPSPKSSFAFVRSISTTVPGVPGPPQSSPAHLQVPLCWARQPRDGDNQMVVWVASEVLNKEHHWPLSESAHRAAPPGAREWALPSLLPARRHRPPKHSRAPGWGKHPAAGTSHCKP